jgi:hypothetical protein
MRTVAISLGVWFLATSALAQSRDDFYRQRDADDQAFWHQHNIEQGAELDDGLAYPPGITTNSPPRYDEEPQQ